MLKPDVLWFSSRMPGVVVGVKTVKSTIITTDGFSFALVALRKRTLIIYESKLYLPEARIRGPRWIRENQTGPAVLIYVSCLDLSQFDSVRPSDGIKLGLQPRSDRRGSKVCPICRYEQHFFFIKGRGGK